MTSTMTNVQCLALHDWLSEEAQSDLRCLGAWVHMSVRWLVVCHNLWVCWWMLPSVWLWKGCGWVVCDSCVCVCVCACVCVSNVRA